MSEQHQQEPLSPLIFDLLAYVLVSTGSGFLPALTLDGVISDFDVPIGSVSEVLGGLMVSAAQAVVRWNSRARHWLSHWPDCVVTSVGSFCASSGRRESLVRS